MPRIVRCSSNSSASCTISASASEEPGFSIHSVQVVINEALREAGVSVRFLYFCRTAAFKKQFSDLAKPEKGHKYGETLYRESRAHDKKGCDIYLHDAELPDQAGIDSFLLLIDRIPDDNAKKVTLTTEVAQRPSARH
jgi:hypothetical protein